MKKIHVFCALLLFVLTQAQQNKITFTKQLKYTAVGARSSELHGGFHQYGNASGEFLSSFTAGMNVLWFFSDKIGMSQVTVQLGNKLEPSLSSLYYFGMSAANNNEMQDAEIQKLGTKETVNGVLCENYLFSFYEGDREYASSKEKLKLCIDEKSSFNNVPVLTGMISQFGGPKISANSLKGLILKGGVEERYLTDYIVLDTSKDITENVYFNHRDAMMKQQKSLDSMMVLRSRFERDYADVYADSVAVAIDSAASVWDEKYFGEIEKYESTYKKAPEEVTYAIDNLPSDAIWEALPKHCRNLDKNLPAISNKEFVAHLRNLTGQMCDMYITQTQSHNVAVKMTLDDIRREFLYINSEKSKLNKADQKKVDQYLEGLD